MPRPFGRDPFTAMTVAMTLKNAEPRKENCVPRSLVGARKKSSSHFREKPTKTPTKKTMSALPTPLSSLVSAPQVSGEKAVLNSSDDFAASSLLLLRTSSMSSGGVGEKSGLFSSGSLSIGAGNDIERTTVAKKKPRTTMFRKKKEDAIVKIQMKLSPVVTESPQCVPSTKTKFVVFLPLTALRAKRRADLGKLYDLRELLRRANAVERTFSAA
jgi:hypothetical protein